MATVWIYTKLLLIGAAVFLAFRYVGGFSMTQSLVLTMVAWLGYSCYLTLEARFRVGEAFSPFWVRVSPNWYDLLRDCRVVQSDEKTFWADANSAWRDLQKESERDSADAYSVLRNDIVFTVLKPAPFDSLIYWNSHRIFRSEVDFEERIEEVKVERANVERIEWSPDVYFKWGRDGYELGLEVNAEWWKETCVADKTGQLAKVETDPEYLTGRTRLLVAILPYSEFDIYKGGNALASAYDAATLKKREEKRDAELTKAGWKREEKDAELDLLGAPDRVEHKYFTIEHRAI